MIYNRKSGIGVGSQEMIKQKITKKKKFPKKTNHTNIHKKNQSLVQAFPHKVQL